MVNISKRKLDDIIFNKLLSLLFEIFALKRKEQDFKSFFVSLFSYTERIMLIKRVGIIYLSLKGLKNNEICKLLKISSATLNKYKLILDKNIDTYNYFEKLIKFEKISNIIEEILNLVYSPGTPGVDWSEARKTKIKIANRKKYGL